MRGAGNRHGQAEIVELVDVEHAIFEAELVAQLGIQAMV